jgi:hypothetical protein
LALMTVTVGRALVVAATLFCAVSASASAKTPARVLGRCRVPHLDGLTLKVARRRAAHSGCGVLVKGARLEEPAIQTIERQSARARGRSLTVWINPLCHRESAYGPGLNEPVATPGATELVSGFYLVGGPLRVFSTSGCKLPPPRPGGGTVEVVGASGAVVATQTSQEGHFVEVPLPPGSYTIIGTFSGAAINGAHPTQAEALVIPAGETVRQDFFLSVP